MALPAPDTRRLFRSVLAILVGSAHAAAQAPGEVDFARDIRPILADRCYPCHGPDERARKAKLRLDRREVALAPRRDPDRRVIDPGHADRSELFRRVSSDDPEERMPPTRSKIEPLDARQIELVRNWIDGGATWGEHWSFAALPRAVAPPLVQREDQARNPVDAFVLARLDAAGLAPAPEATREQLIRRVSFDLQGLPPTLSEIDAFVADEQTDAYERLVDRLLASPRFGERMASTWLDAARYADTLGYQADREQAVWRWRDWVIGAFNDNLPYDEFVVWQLAGDLLPDATQEQRLATAFNRLHRQTEEGGTVEEEFRVEYVVDRTDTFGTAVLGLTLGCARCHDHKFDPISQRDYYRLFAFFNNIDESGQTSHFTDSVPVPTLLLPDAEAEAEIGRIDSEIEGAERRLASVRDETDAAFNTWRASRPELLPLRGLVAALPLDAIDNGRLPNTADANNPGRAIDDPTPIAGHRGGGLLLSGENAVQLTEVADFHRSDPFSIGLWVQVEKTVERAVIVHKTKAALDAASRGYQLLLEDGCVTACLAHMWPHNSIKVRARDELPVGQWTHLLMAYDGSSRAAGLSLYVDGQLSDVEVVRDRLTKDIVYQRGGQPPLTIGQRFRDRGFAGGRVDDLTVFDRCLTALEAAELASPGALAEALSAPEPTPALRDLYLATTDPTWRRHRAELQRLRNAQRRAVEDVPEIMTMVEMAPPRPAHLLERGAYDAPAQRVTPGTPANLPPFGDRRPDRLGLALWATDGDHPLTARVAVNRLWQTIFGRGLVATPEDFGSQGETPSHPPLLDWLARQFVDSGWDVKAMVRLLVTSAAYRQSSMVEPALRERDPDNALLGRASSYRWPAEMIRDAALATSGLLVERRGGPPVRPYQPAGLWRETSDHVYQPSQGDDLYRRSLYTYWKRTSPPPAMLLFDMPRRHECTVRRQRTNTPLQALVLLNDPQFVECARVLAEYAVREAADERERLVLVFRKLTGRRPGADELAVLEPLYREQRTEFASHPERAAELLAVGEKPVDTTLPPLELAATTVLANAVLCLDETVTRR